MVFKIRNIAGVIVLNNGYGYFTIDMIVTHDNKLFIRVKNGSSNSDYEIARIKPHMPYHVWEESKVVSPKHLMPVDWRLVLSDDFSLINANIDKIKNKMFHRLSKKEDFINISRKLKIEIHYYNSKRIGLNDELNEYVPASKIEGGLFYVTRS